MEIRPATEVDETALRAYYASAHEDRAAFLSAHWKWLYRVGEFRGVSPLVLVDGGKVVGHAGAIPVELSVAGKKATAIWFVDFSVAPELQGRGHGRTLTEAWMRMCPDRVTFCNERSLRVFQKLGWRSTRDTKTLTLPVALPSRLWKGLKGLDRPWRAAAVLPFKGAPRLEATPLPDDAAGLAFLEDKTTGPKIVRDASWARWRFLTHPRAGEYRLMRHGGVSAVVRFFESLGRKRAHLVHVGPGPDAERAALVRGFTRWAFEVEADAAWLAANDPVLLAAAEGAFYRAHETRFAWHGEDPAFADELHRGLPVQGADSDHDLLFPC